MKKVGSLVLSLVLCMSLCACGGAAGNGGAADNGGNKEIVLTDEQLLDFVEVVELTDANWQTYFYIEEVVEESKDSFGAVTSTEVFYPIRMHMTNSFAYAYYNTYNNAWSEYVEIRCTDTVTGNERSLYPVQEYYNMIDAKDYLGREIALSEFSAIKSSCKLVFLNVPQEYWNQGEGGQEYICYQGSKLFKGARVEDDAVLSLIADQKL